MTISDCEHGALLVLHTITKNDTELFELLLSKGVWLNDECLLRACELNRTKFVQEMFEHTAEYDAGATDIPTVMGVQNAFMTACRTPNIDLAIVEIIIKKGADVYADKGASIKLASRNDNVSLLKLLLKYEPTSAQVNDAIKILSEVVISATTCGYRNVLGFFLDRGLDINHMDGSSHTLLERASMFGQLNIVRELLERKADVNANQGVAMNNAVHKGNIDIVKLLIEYRADLTIGNNCPLRIARGADHEELISLLEKYS
jgi:ankyrin repeat protein